MTVTFHLTRYDYTLGWQGPVVAHDPTDDVALTQGSTWATEFRLVGDRTSSDWFATIANHWKSHPDYEVLATASCTATYDEDADLTTISVVFDGDDIGTINATQNVTTARERAKAVEGVNYYVWEFLEEPTNGLPEKHFTGFLEVHPGAT